MWERAERGCWPPARCGLPLFHHPPQGLLLLPCSQVRCAAAVPLVLACIGQLPTPQIHPIKLVPCRRPAGQGLPRRRDHQRCSSCRRLVRCSRSRRRPAGAAAAGRAVPRGDAAAGADDGGTGHVLRLQPRRPQCSERCGGRQRGRLVSTRRGAGAAAACQPAVRLRGTCHSMGCTRRQGDADRHRRAWRQGVACR